MSCCTKWLFNVWTCREEAYHRPVNVALLTDILRPVGSLYGRTCPVLSVSVNQKIDWLVGWLIGWCVANFITYHAVIVKYQQSFCRHLSSCFEHHIAIDIAYYIHQCVCIYSASVAYIDLMTSVGRAFSSLIRWWVHILALYARWESMYPFDNRNLLFSTTSE